MLMVASEFVPVRGHTGCLAGTATGVYSYKLLESRGGTLSSHTSVYGAQPFNSF